MNEEKKELTDEERKELKENLKKQIDEMSDEELDKVAGGQWQPDEWTPLCPKCKGYTTWLFPDDESNDILICKSCGFKFTKDPWGKITEVQ